jgi:NADPH:quinone reductase-like Zn-dependent oxidoreductase
MVASGGYSEELCLPFSSVRKISANLDYSQAAALPVNYLTAWFSLFTMGNLQPGDRLLVHGGAGGVGMAAIQLALEHPVEIFTTVGSERKKEFLAKLGVDHVINYRKSEFVEYIRSKTDDEGVEVILDGVGGKTLSNSYLLLAPLGRLISYGLSSAVSSHRKNWLSLLKAWRRTPRFAPLDLIGRNVGVFGFHLALLGSKQSKVHEAFDAVLHKAETGRVSPVLAAQFPLSASGAIQAHQYLHDRRNIGKVVLARQEELGKWA